MSETVLLPGARDVRATLDTPEADACVVACPPHPQMGGKRTDRRLQAVSDHLAPDVACLRFDYGAWDEGRGEVADCRNALAWAREEYGNGEGGRAPGASGGGGSLPAGPVGGTAPAENT